MSDAGAASTLQSAKDSVAALQWMRAPGWVHRLFDDEILLYSPAGDVVTIAGIGVAVWDVLERAGSVAQVTERITRRWPTRPMGAASVSEAFDLLAAAGVIEGTNGGIARFWGVTEDGETVEVVVGQHLVDELLTRWPLRGLDRHADRPDAAREPLARLGVSDTGLFVPDDLAEVGRNPEPVAWGLLEQTLTSIAVQHLTHLVAVHCAVIAWQGSVMLVPATSGSGKSTITVAAHHAGATVLSDEYALVDPDSGLVTGWARPVRVRNDDGTEDRLDLAVVSDPLPVGLVASVVFDPTATDAASWSPASAAAAVFDLLANTICAQTRPDAALDAAMAIARNAAAVHGTRGPATEAIGELLILLEAHGGTVEQQSS